MKPLNRSFELLINQEHLELIEAVADYLGMTVDRYMRVVLVKAASEQAEEAKRALVARERRRRKKLTEEE